MAFTSPDLVRAHLNGLRLGEAAITAATVILNAATPSQLPHQGLIAGSVIVKSRRSIAPVHESRTLGSGWIILGHAQLIADSVVVANDSSLGQVYLENLDYVVDCAGGRVRRIDSGDIAPAQSVVIWYSHFHVYTEGDDYSVNTSAGEISRRSTGDIADGQQVQVDYTVALGSVSDAMIDQAIAESGEAVLLLVNDIHHDSPAPGLVIGATHLAVAQLARMRAAATLADSSISASVARAAAQLWLDIASQYDRWARTFLARFANPVAARSALRRG